MNDHPLADRRVQGLMGLTSATFIAVIGIAFFDGLTTLAFVGFGLADAIVTPYVLGLAFEQSAEDSTV